MKTRKLTKVYCSEWLMFYDVAVTLNCKALLVHNDVIIVAP